LCRPGVLAPFFLLLLLPVGPPARADAAADRFKSLMEQGWALEGRMHVDPANLDKAIAVHEEALSLAPDNDEALWRLGEVIFKKSEEVKDKEERKAMVEKTISLAEQAPMRVRALGGTGTGLGRFVSAAVRVFPAIHQ